MVKRRTWRGRLYALCCALLFLLSAAPVCAQAAAYVKPDHPGDLTVRLRHKYEIDGVERDIPGVEARIYRVADMDEEGVFTATPDFQSYPVDLASAEPPKNWLSLAAGMESFVNARALTPMLVKTAGDDGRVLFDRLEPGLYLLLFGEGIHPDHAHIRVGFMPTLMSMPYRGVIDWNEDGLSTTHIQEQENPKQWDFAFTIIPKPEETKAVCRVQKIWDDGNREDLRPRTLRVELEYEDGVRQTLSLSVADGWLAEIVADSQARVKLVRELNLPPDYELLGWELIGSTVQLTNRIVPKPSPSQAPSPSPKPSPKIPQTGMLWWPVPVLLVSGAALMLFGWLHRRCGG